MLADVKQTLLENGKCCGGPERLYRRWPFSRPLEEKGCWGNGSGRSWAQTGADGAGRQLPGPIIPDVSRPSEAQLPSHHNLSPTWPACRPIEGEQLRHDCSLRNAKSLTACKAHRQARCDICSMNQYHLQGSKTRHVASC